jgi:hypothetical protein
MSIEVTDLVWEAQLKPNEMLVLLAHADHAHPDGTSVFPGTALLVKKTGLSERWVREIRRRLVERGLLVVTRPSTPTSPTHYRIDLEQLRQLADGGELTAPPEPAAPPELGTGPELSRGKGVNPVPRGGAPSAPKPPGNHQKEPPPGTVEIEDTDGLEAEIEAEYQEAARKTEVRSPSAYKKKIRLRKLAERQATAEQAERQRQYQATIDACLLCNTSGIILWETEDEPLSQQCTHNSSDYEGYEIATAASESMNAAV